MIHVGIDEAGYGPLLGPLVVAAAVFRVPPGDRPTLRERLNGIVCRAGAPAGRKGRKEDGLPVEVDDSKAIHPVQGLPGLSRGISAFVAASRAAPPSDLRDLLDRFADRPSSAFAGDPWYAEPERASWPRWEAPTDLPERVALRGVTPLQVLVSPMTARELNGAFDATGNKARVLFLATAAVLARVLDAWPGEDLTVTLDREGGRLDYEGYLADAFPFHEIRRLPAPEGEASYAVREGGRDVRLRFATHGDRIDLATGLASMAAKATRELFMSRLNAWFSARQGGLLPTAGYVEDGRRFLADVAPVLDREGVDRAAFVRSR